VNYDLYFARINSSGTRAYNPVRVSTNGSNPAYDGGTNVGDYHDIWADDAGNFYCAWIRINSTQADVYLTTIVP